jgi:hypothetical protein
MRSKNPKTEFIKKIENFPSIHQDLDLFSFFFFIGKRKDVIPRTIVIQILLRINHICHLLVNIAHKQYVNWTKFAAENSKTIIKNHLPDILPRIILVKNSEAVADACKNALDDMMIQYLIA